MGVKSMLGRYSLLGVLCALFAVQSAVLAQGVTFLIKGKVVDSKRNVLQGVQVYAKDGDEIVGKSKTTIAGEFTMTLKPGKTYFMSFERSDLFMSQQDFRVPDGKSYQEINQDFQVKVLAKGDTIQQFTLFQEGQSNSKTAELFTMLPEMMRKLLHLKVKIVVSAGNGAKQSTKGKKEKNTQKAKGKKGVQANASAPLTLIEKRIQDIRSKLIAAGAPESRIIFEEGKLKSSKDVALIVASIASDF
jgi:hypothetical protein